MKVSKITRVAVDRLRINEGQLDWLPKNPRTWTQTDIDRMVRSIEEDPDFAEVRPVLATPAPDGSLVVFAHNLLTRAAQVRGDRDLPVAVFEPETDEDRETVCRLALKDNGTFGSWDTDILANEWKAEPWQLEAWGVPEWITGGAGKAGTGSGTESGSLTNPYSTKMQAPIYEIRGEQPTESELVEMGKVDELLANINASNVPEEVKSFLRVCAYRHAVIDFENMAEYYAHAPKEVQELMEENALVIIDFDKAVENGFVRMSKDLDAIYAKNKEILYGTE